MTDKQPELSDVLHSEDDESGSIDFRRYYQVLRKYLWLIVAVVALGVTAINPAGLVVGLLTGTEGTKIQFATGEYNKKLDAKIAEIQRECGIR